MKNKTNFFKHIGRRHFFCAVIIFILLLVIVLRYPIFKSGAIPSETPNVNTWGVNGSVNAIVVGADGTTYIGGAFTQVGRYIGSGVLADKNTGVISTTFPKVNGTINAAVPDGSGGWYIGGAFTQVGSETRNRLAHIDSSGNVDLSWDPNMGGTVNAIVLDGSTVYASGSFVTVNGSTTRNRLAAFDTTTGTATSWNPNISGSVFSILLDGATLYAGGAFTTVNGSTTRNRLAAFDTTTGTATSWNPNVSGSVSKIFLDGATLYAGGAFTTVNGSTTRNRLAAFDTTTGTATSWNPNVNNTVRDILKSGSNIYIGGNFTTVNGSTTRNRLAALDITTATATSWDPNVSGANNVVFSIALDGSNIFAAGSFSTVNGSIARNNIAAFDVTTGTDSSFELSSSVNAGINVVAFDGTDMFVGGSFALADAVERNHLAALDPDTGEATSWNPDATDGAVNALSVDGSTIYAGGDFTTVNGSLARNFVAAFNNTDGTATAWDPDMDGNVSSIAVDTDNVYIGGFFVTVNGGAVVRNNFVSIDKTTGLATSLNPNPDAVVEAITFDNDQIFLGGSFTSLSPETGYGFPVDLVNGENNLAFPQVEGTIRAVIPDGSGGWYIGGAFTQVGGETRNHLAHITSAGDLDMSFDPNLDNTVKALALDGSTLYAGGDFTSVNGGTTRNYLAAFSASTGTATSWNPNISGISATVSSVAISGSTIYAGGNFTDVNGGITFRNNLAAFNNTDGTATSWDPDPDAQVNAILIDGSIVYAGGDFINVNNNTTPVASDHLAAFNNTDGTADAASNSLATDGSVYSLTADGTYLYAGGLFTTASTYVELAGRNNMAAYDKIDGAGSDGSVAAWDPNVDNSVFSLMIEGSTIYAGGDFISVNGGAETRNYAAAFNNTDGTADIDWNPNLNSTVFGMAKSGSSIYLGGDFVQATMSRFSLAAISKSTNFLNNWDPSADFTVRDLVVDGTNIYAGGDFTTVNGGTTRNYLAAFDTTTGTATAWDPDVSALVNALLIDGSDIYAGGQFTTVNQGATPETRNRIAVFNNTDGTVGAWNPGANGEVLALAVDNGRIYAGGDFSISGDEQISRFVQFNAPAVIITESSGNTAIFEGNGDDSYEIVLETEPTDDVTVELSTASTDFDLETTTFIFTSLDWNTPQTVNISAVNDDEVEGSENFNVTHTVTSNDLDYNGFVLADVSVNITDNDFTSTDLSGVVNLITPESGDETNTADVTFDTEVQIFVSDSAGNSIVTIPVGTVMTATDASNFDFTSLSTEDTTTFVTGLSGETVISSIQFGIVGTPLTFSVPITISIVVPTSYNGQTLNVFKSENGASGWNNISTCTVADGLCTFTTSSASYFSSTQTAASGGASGSYLPGYGPLAQQPTVPTVTPAPVTLQPAIPTLKPGTKTFEKNLLFKQRDPEVKRLQQFLNQYGYVLAKSGPGSPGQETEFFGSLTWNSLVKFQEVFAKEILVPLGLKRGTGYFGPSTRSFINRAYLK